MAYQNFKYGHGKAKKVEDRLCLFFFWQGQKNRFPKLAVTLLKIHLNCQLKIAPRSAMPQNTTELVDFTILNS